MIEQLLYSVAEHKGIAAIIAFFLAAVESFIPVLPLVAMILANAIIFGMWMGFFISWAGSCIAAIILYFIAKKFSTLKIFDKFRKKLNNQKLKKYIEKQGFSMIFISYLCPFISDFLITILSGFTNFDIKTFISGMVCGKFIMFLFISYVGEDIGSFLSSPFKIILFSLFILGSWMIGKEVNKKMHKDNNTQYL